jgi:hypothetical protein
VAGFIIFIVLLAIVTAAFGGLKAMLIAFGFLLVLGGGAIGIAHLLSRYR